MKKLFSILLSATVIISAPVLAKVSPQDAAKLDNELTPIGAERAGNANG